MPNHSHGQLRRRGSKRRRHGRTFCPQSAANPLVRGSTACGQPAAAVGLSTRATKERRDAAEGDSPRRRTRPGQSRALHEAPTPPPAGRRRTAEPRCQLAPAAPHLCAAAAAAARAVARAREGRGHAPPRSARRRQRQLPVAAGARQSGRKATAAAAAPRPGGSRGRQWGRSGSAAAACHRGLPLRALAAPSRLPSGAGG